MLHQNDAAAAAAAADDDDDDDDGDDDDDDDDEFRRLALFSAANIVRDPHHRESPTRREQSLSLRRT